MTGRKDTRSDEFLVAIRAYFGATEMLAMTKDQREENLERKASWATVAIDFETGMKVHRHKGQVLRQMWKQIAMMGEVEEISELLRSRPPT